MKETVTANDSEEDKYTRKAKELLNAFKSKFISEVAAQAYPNALSYIALQPSKRKYQLPRIEFVNLQQEV